MPNITVQLPAGIINNASIGSGANVSASKLEQQRAVFYTQATGTTVAAASFPIAQVNGTSGTVTAFTASLKQVMTGDRTITIDLKKNGSSILTAVITLDSGNVAYTPEAAAFSSTSLVAGDYLEVVVAISGSSGTQPQGLNVKLVYTELPS